MTTSTEPATAVRASQRRTPDFFIVGHPKCGTTALYEMLRAHPQIYMPELKETRFLAPELHPGTAQAALYPETFEEYLSLFAGASSEQRVGEASPSYLRSRDAAGRIARLRPDARIIALLREPASFLRSLHMELLKDRVETEKDLRKAIAAEDIRREDADLLPGLVYPEYVRYVEQLRRYHAVFPPEQVLVLIYDDFREDNEATVRAVLRFLAVDDTIAVEPIEVNRAVRVRSLRMEGLVRSIYLGRGPAARAIKTGVKTLTPQKLRRDALATVRRRVLHGKPDAPDEQLMLALRHRFNNEVVAVSEYLDRDLVTLWGYDKLG